MDGVKGVLRGGINPRDWMLCFVGEDQPNLLVELTSDLKREFSQDGTGKVVRSGFSYWGLGPTMGWARSTTDVTYPNAQQAIASFKERWRTPRISERLLESGFGHVYVSLGVGTADKDVFILEDLLARSENKVLLFAVDISVEMLKIAVNALARRFSDRVEMIAVQIDLSIKSNLDRLQEIILESARGLPVLYSLLGNTIANFEQDELRLAALTGLMRPQDRFLIEVAISEKEDEKAAIKAASEYSGSSRFKNFASGSLVANTNLPVQLKNIRVDPCLERSDNGEVKSILLKVLYVSEYDVKFRLADMDEQDSVSFIKNDTIRIYVTRKYTHTGLLRLLSKVGCYNVHNEYRPFRATGADPHPCFGMSLYLIGRSEEHVSAEEEPRTLPE